MPRAARVKSSTGIYHIMLRGGNRETIFKDEEDAWMFLETLAKYKEVSGYEIYAYCLMGNHVHILIKESKEDLSTAMRRIGASYVYRYNTKYERVGHLFQDRYKSEAVEDDRYLLTVLRYIHQNPIKAGLVKNLLEYKWSSYVEYLNKEKIIDSEFILGLFHENVNKARISFRKFHEVEEKAQCLDVDEKRIIRDSDAIGIIKEVCNISNCQDMQKLDRVKMDSYIKGLRERGLSTRQIARLTGISRSVIMSIEI